MYFVFNTNSSNPCLLFKIKIQSEAEENNESGKKSDFVVDFFTISRVTAKNELGSDKVSKGTCTFGNGWGEYTLKRHDVRIKHTWFS